MALCWLWIGSGVVCSVVRMYVECLEPVALVRVGGLEL